MDTSGAEALLAIARGYAAIGALVALPFAFFVAPRIDPGARRSSIAFRAMLLPGAIVLWPVVVWRSVRALRAGGESTR